MDPEGQEEVLQLKKTIITKGSSKAQIVKAQVWTFKSQTGPKLLWWESSKSSQVIAQVKQPTRQV